MFDHRSDAKAIQFWYTKDTMRQKDTGILRDTKLRLWRLISKTISVRDK